MRSSAVSFIVLGLALCAIGMAVSALRPPHEQRRCLPVPGQELMDSALHRDGTLICRYVVLRWVDRK